MTNALFIGNSHLAALKLAWADAAPPGVEVTFFGAPKRTWLAFAPLPGNHYGFDSTGKQRSHRKVAESLNGVGSVALEDRDAIVLVGEQNAHGKLANLLSICDISGIRETGCTTLLSVELFAKCCRALAEKALPDAFWWNRADLGPIAILQQPAPSETIRASTNRTHWAWNQLAANPIGLSTAHEALDDALTLAFAAKGLTYLRQPPATLTEAGLTQSIFLGDGLGVQEGSEDGRGDHSHMNHAYGVHCAAHLIPWLTGQGQTGQTQI